jgi:hypothetical protein
MGMLCKIGKGFDFENSLKLVTMEILLGLKIIKE